MSTSGVMVIAALYPVYIAHTLRHGPAEWRDIGLQAGSAFPFHSMPVEAFLAAIFGVYAIAFAVAITPKTDRERVIVLLAPAPLMVWTGLAFVIPSNAADVVACGVIYASLVAIATWAMTVVEAAPVRSTQPATGA